jgi:hypothetical protein
VTRDICEAVHTEQREANHRTWEEIRTLRRLVIGLVIGGQLFSGGLNLAGFGYWLQQHTAQPHPATIQMIAAARTEAREDFRDLRREVRDLAAQLSTSQPTDGKTSEPRP